jgi:hypothetical protein
MERLRSTGGTGRSTHGTVGAMTTPRRDDHDEPLAMSEEDVRMVFPYGLPASLRRRQSFQDSNVISIERYRRLRARIKGGE